MFREYREHFFTWFGIVGAAVTIVGHWSSFLMLADWVRSLSEHYVVLLTTLWNWFGQYFGLHVPQQVAMLLSLILFIGSFTVGAYLQQGKSKRGIRRYIIFIGSLTLIMFAGWFISFVGRLYSNEFSYGRQMFYGLPVLTYVIFVYLFLDKKIVQSIAYLIFSLVVYLTFYGAADALTVFLRRGYGLEAMFIYALTSSVLLAFILFIPLVPFAFAQPIAVLRRTNFILIGVVLIIALSELSKLVEIGQLPSKPV